MADYTLRGATRRDNDALIALERRSPLLLGDLELAFDRSPDYFVAQRLQERSRMVVAEHDGGLVGVCASAVHWSQLLGKEQLLAYTHHLRIDPAFQRHGIGRALPRALTEAWDAARISRGGGYAFVEARNEASLAYVAAGSGAGPWPVDGWLQELPPLPEAEDRSVETLTEDDLDEVVALLNVTHAGLELFPQATPKRLEARLRRTPEYSWSSWRGLRRGGRLIAAAGLHDQGAGFAALAHDRRSGEVHESRWLVVLDYAFAPGEAPAMAALLAMLQGKAAAMQRDALELSVPECSPLFPLVMEGMAGVSRFKFLGGTQRPPPEYPLRGVYIDPAYL